MTAPWRKRRNRKILARLLRARRAPVVPRDGAAQAPGSPDVWLAGLRLGADR
ncbi:hypothetical protein [Streptomyces sp. NPDC059862]|uniref:hypothetical protein n=1 Tax=unclassified Streptomyces TaxID=2593676 RepID=UPI003633466E